MAGSLSIFSSDEADLSPQDSSQQSQDSYAPELPVSQQANKSQEKEVEIEQLRRETRQLRSDLMEKTEEVEKQKIKIKEQSQCIKDLRSQKELNTKEYQTLTKQNLEICDKMFKYETKITDLESEISCLQMLVKEVTQENKSLKRIANETMVPTRDCGPRRSTRLQRLQSLSKIEEIKGEINKTDVALRGTLNQMAQMCQDLRDPSRMVRKWKSDIRLEYHHSDSSFTHSQV